MSASRELSPLLSSVAVVRMADRAALVVTGKDRVSWLNGMVTCDVAKLEPGRAMYGLLVEKKGRIQTDFFVVASGDALLLTVPRELREATRATLDHHLIMEDAELTTPDLSIFHAAGPRSGDLVRALGGAAAFAGDLDLLGTGGAVLAASDEARVRAETEKLGGALVDETTWAALCVERGLPRFGVEFDATFYPQEANLEKLAVSFSKGCYLGQEVVYMLENRGHVKRKLVPLDLAGEGPVQAGAPVTTADGVAVGEVKSSAMAPTRNLPVAIAMVKWAQTQPGTELIVDGRRATVRAFP